MPGSQDALKIQICFGWLFICIHSHGQITGVKIKLTFFSRQVPKMIIHALFVFSINTVKSAKSVKDYLRSSRLLLRFSLFKILLILTLKISQLKPLKCFQKSDISCCQSGYIISPPLCIRYINSRNGQLNGMTR